MIITIIYLYKAAGESIGFSDESYTKSGAIILESAKEVYANSELVKVKEPMPSEFEYLTNEHTLFTYLHLAGNKNKH